MGTSPQPIPTDRGFLPLPYEQIQGRETEASANFESFCAELAVAVEGLRPSTIVLGRKGQKQWGLDVYGRGRGVRVGLQCKLEQHPASAKTAQAKLKKWVATYLEMKASSSTELGLHSASAENHRPAELTVDRLVVCVPWVADTHLVGYLDELVEYGKKSDVEVDVWFRPYLDRVASAHPAIVERYFSANLARGVIAAAGERRAAAVRTGLAGYYSSIAAAEEGVRRERPQVLPDISGEDGCVILSEDVALVSRR